ncbi:putative secreted protein [Wickerhamomyces ciferrii]|uniref:Secreted protein n=1 Tax=Wickerhamomyces ciferrii (strain ATCC 14091 / BCRC 22168 / CBS 111 / JCM 3599 / NBRC 0793 / NRRL Y-1031 F-60-10) TaxID=1206466 RepID=K0KND0_WICCF|nr:uncharacterized protein BN7_6354 [Wickerhamomyces ciferrii]CCH46755.1 putative secreted protein [Wickerhamomyces ciferrii]
MLLKKCLSLIVPKLGSILVLAAVIDHEQILKDSEGLSKYVDVFFGTEAGGNVFPGPTRPFGMVKMGVDVSGASSGDAYSGYAPDGYITGISMMHESGTGGAPQYGVVSQLASVGDDVDVTKDQSQTRLSNISDDAHVGLYKTHLANGVNVTFAASDRSGVFDYEFPADITPNVIVNASHHLVAPSRPWWTQYFVNGSIETSNDALNSYSGETTIKGGWGEQNPWTIYFYGEFSTKAKKISSFQGSNKRDNNSKESSSTQDEQFGLIFQFEKGTHVQSKVGISFLSKEQAKKNLENDFPESSDFDTLKTAKETQKLWNEKVFNKVKVSNENSTLTGLIYTSLYGTHLLPSNRTGENPKWNTGEPYYDDWFTLWDTFRSTMPLFNVLQPEYSSEMIRSLIDIYRHDGYMPDGRSANQNGRTQGGSNSDIVLGDAFVKNIDGINWKDGYDAMVKNAEVDPPYVYDSFSADDSTKEGRGGLSDWKSKGYISRNFNRSVTRTVEYSYNDYALSVVAKGLGHDDDSEKYLKRSAGWQNLWNKEASSSKVSYKGFLQPKNGNGSWATTNYDPTSCGGCYWSDDEYEGSPIEYGWAVPHDFQTLFKAIGDNGTVIKRLDDMFKLYGEGFADIGNEPSFLTPYLYNYVGSQYRTAETIRFLIDTRFSIGPKALPGNSDAGSMQSWLFFGLIGLYPVASTTTYLLSVPYLERITLDVGKGAKLDILTENFSPQNRYVQSVEVNGKNWDKNWVTHDDLFNNGGSIKFILGSEPNNWDTGAIPPSSGNHDLGLI